jgi:excisionase family DNA binding protein
MNRRSFYTTFEVGAICEVNPTTVQNWVKEKKLKAYATPGGHRRIRRSDLVSFLQQFDMPLPSELRSGRTSVLIVDDEKAVRDLLVSAVASWDDELDIRTAPSGVEALLAIGESKPDLLVLDVMMPGMNGIEVCRKLKSSSGTRKIKIIAITGKPEPEIRERTLKAGADVFLAKPFDMKAFRDASLKLIRS